MAEINVGYANNISLGNKKVVKISLGSSVIYPAIVGYETKEEYSTWDYSITISSGSRTRTVILFERAIYGNGTYGEWVQKSAKPATETGSKSSQEINTSAWGYTWAMPIGNSTRSQTYQIRITYTFSDTTKSIDTSTQTRTESGQGTYNVFNIVDRRDGTITADGNGVIIKDASCQLLWSGVEIVRQEGIRVIWTSVDAGFQIGNPAIGYGTDSIFRLVNNTSTNVVSGTAVGNIATQAGSVPIPNQTVQQNAGVIVYGTPIISAFGYPDIPASGGTVNPNLYNWSQPYTWNGVPGSGGTTTSGGVAYYSNTTGAVSASNKYQSPSGRTWIGTITTRVDANGVTGQNISADVYQAQNRKETRNTYCSGYTRVYVYYYPDSGAPDSTLSINNSESCGYSAPHFNLVVHLATDWNIVRNKIGQDWVDLNFNIGNNEFDVPITHHGEWNANINQKEWDAKGYKFAMGGASQSGGDDTFFWAVPAYCSVTNKSGGLAFFNWDIDLLENSGAVENIPLAAHYGI